MEKPPGVVPPGGVHLLIDLFDAKNLDAVDPIRTICIDAAKATRATIVSETFHHFGEGCGVTGIVVLAESHISIHTWPENGIVTIDVYVCGECNAFVTIPMFLTFFETKDAVITSMVRGRRSSS